MTPNQVTSTFVQMRRFTSASRALVIALSVVQMAVPALVAIADAQLAWRSDVSAHAHVEDHTGRACRAAHIENCALCGFLSSAASHRANAPVLPLLAVARPGTRSDSSLLPTSIARARQRTRGPPVG